MNVIDIKNLSFGYFSEHDVLKNVNMQVKEGDFLCIVGENGSGKSTLIKCILGLNKVTKGEINVNGRIGYLPQMTEVQNNFPATIEEIVLSGTLPDNIKRIFYTKEDKQKAKETMEKLQLYEMRKKCFYELSGGQKQRVLIARSLCATDKIILLDEPVNGLDPKIVIEIYELLQKLNREHGITIVMVSHDVERAVQYATRVIEIKNGQVTKDIAASEYGTGGASK
ncbi:MAG: metal ABC transporter ATP-binding protein [Clostridia bacterium]|nr:metal ABC transporter ATP-binding protein [Clostridia bacterium]